MSTTAVWLHGLIAAFIGGGSAAVSTALSSMVVAPDKFNLGTGLLPMLKLIGITFVVSGGLAAFAYLKQSPVPPGWDGTDRRGGSADASPPKP